MPVLHAAVVHACTTSIAFACTMSPVHACTIAMAHRAIHARQVLRYYVSNTCMYYIYGTQSDSHPLGAPPLGEVSNACLRRQLLFLFQKSVSWAFKPTDYVWAWVNLLHAVIGE